MAYVEVPDSDLDADSPLTETLMIQLNDNIKSNRASEVTGGNTHNHEGGDGAEIPTGGLEDDAVNVFKEDYSGFSAFMDFVDSAASRNEFFDNLGTGTLSGFDISGGALAFAGAGGGAGYKWLESHSKIFNLADGDITAEFRLRDGTTGTVFECGLTEATAQGILGASTDGIGFYRNTGTNKIACRTEVGSVVTTTDTDVDISTSFKNLRFIATTTSVEFYVDGVLKATITTDIPTSVAMFGFCGVDTTTSNIIDYAYMRFHQSGRAA